MARKIVVIVAHTDDETIGCGGTLLRHFEAGDSIHAISMTNGVGSRTGSGSEDSVRRRASAESAAHLLGFQWRSMEDFPDNAMDTVPFLDVVKAVESTKEILRPEVVYTHWPHDLNVDHRIVHQAVMTAFRPQPGETWTEIRCFEVPSATDWGSQAFSPNLFVEITDQWSRKAAALQCYSEELREPPHSRSLAGIETLATLRGFQAGFMKAEAFHCPIRRLPAGVVP